MTDGMTIGVVSPGAMGAALAARWRAGGARTVATVAGRSERTASLARDLTLLPSLADVVVESDVLVSVVPPAAALRVAEDIAALAVSRAVTPLVLDLNATAPSTIKRVKLALDRGGCVLVDGAISGPPPKGESDTIMYLSGARAEWVSALAMPGVDVRVLGRKIGTASAVKICTTSVYKGFTALLAQALQTAEHHEVTELVLAELSRDFPAHVEHVARLLAAAASMSDWIPGEMREIAKAQSDAGAQKVLFDALAEVYEAIDGSALARMTPEQAGSARDLSVVLAELARR